MKSIILCAIVLLLPSMVFARENMDGHIRSSVYELETQLSRSLEAKVMQLVGIENIWLSVHLDVSHDNIKQQLSEKKRQKNLRYEELPGLNIFTDGNIVQETEGENKVVLDGSKFSVDPALILSSTESMMVTVYNKQKIDKKVERLIRSLIEDKMSSLKINVAVSFNYRKARVLEAANLDEGKKIRFESRSFAKSVQDAVVATFEEFVNEKVLLPIKIGFGALFFISLCAFGVLGYFLYRGLSSINSSLGALTNAARNFETTSAAVISEKNEVKDNHSQTATLQADAVDLQQKILDIYTNYSEVISSFFMNAMDKREFKDVWALTQVLGDKILVENKNICRNENFHLYNRFLRNSMHLVTSAEDFKRIYQKLMSLMLYPEVFFLNSIRNQVNSFSITQLITDFPKFDEKEKLMVIEVLEDVKLATLINKGLINTKNLAFAEEKLWDMQDLKRIDKKLTTMAHSEHKSDRHAVLGVMKFFSQAQFDSFILEHGIGQNYSFSGLYHANKEEMDQYFKGLSTQHLSSLLPMLEEDMVGNILALLPEIKLARVNAMPKVVSEKSFELMAEVHRLLWTDDFVVELTKLSPSKSELKVA